MAGGPELFVVLCLIPEGKEGGKGLRDVVIILQICYNGTECD